MRLRLAGVNDLIAAEVKYHNKCLNAFKYDTQKTKKKCEPIDLAMIFLIESEHVTPCSCFGDSTSTFCPSALASKVLICF
jgi:hypothetical protein